MWRSTRRTTRVGYAQELHEDAAAPRWLGGSETSYPRCRPRAPWYQSLASPYSHSRGRLGGEGRQAGQTDFGTGTGRSRRSPAPAVEEYERHLGPDLYDVPALGVADGQLVRRRLPLTAGGPRGSATGTWANALFASVTPSSPTSGGASRRPGAPERRSRPGEGVTSLSRHRQHQLRGPRPAKVNSLAGRPQLGVRIRICGGVVVPVIVGEV